MTAAIDEVSAVDPGRDDPPTWHLSVSCDAKLITPNDRTPWRRKAEIAKTWREAAFYAAQQAKLPKGLARVRIDATIHPKVNRARDRANWVDAVKPLVDGLGPPFVQVGKKSAAAVGYGLIADDSDDILDGPHVEIGLKVGKGEPHRIDLTVVDLSALAPARTWTPDRVTADGATRVTVKRACNGCGRLVGDVLMGEIEVAFQGGRLPDVRSECRWCRAVAS